MKGEVNHKNDEREKGGLGIESSVEAKRRMSQSIVEPTPLYGCEAWVLYVVVRRRLEAVMLSLRAMCGVNIIQRIQSLEIRYLGYQMYNSELRRAC